MIASLPSLHVGQGEPIGSVSFPIGVVWLKRVEEDMALATWWLVHHPYRWWTKSCTTKDDDYPTISRVLTIPGGAGFGPSTVWKIQIPSFPQKIRGDNNFKKTVVDNPPSPFACWIFCFNKKALILTDVQKTLSTFQPLRNQNFMSIPIHP